MFIVFFSSALNLSVKSLNTMCCTYVLESRFIKFQEKITLFYFELLITFLLSLNREWLILLIKNLKTSVLM